MCEAIIHKILLIKFSLLIIKFMCRNIDKNIHWIFADHFRY